MQKLKTYLRIKEAAEFLGVSPNATTIIVSPALDFRQKAKKGSGHPLAMIT
ncbi:MAG: hypothetical protein AB7O38_07085 [Pirellulaceae bacterium]